VALEIFGLIFLIFKLTIAPLFRFFEEKMQRKKSNRVTIVEEVDEEHLEGNNRQGPTNSVKKIPFVTKKSAGHWAVGLNRTLYK
jgi:hypothetical protein